MSDLPPKISKDALAAARRLFGEMDAPAGSTVKFTGSLREQQDSGELVALAVVMYRPGTDQIEHYFPLTISEEEAVAMLRRYKCFPR